MNTCLTQTLRRRIAPWLSLLLLAGVTSGVQANTSDYPELPAGAEAVQAIRQHPRVKASGHQIHAAEAHRERLIAGPHEWTLRLARQQREIRTLPNERFSEWETNLERPLRLPGKAATDEALGTTSVTGARIAQGDALHETSRLLLALWFNWSRQKESLTQWQAQVELLTRQAQAVSRRAALGDASRLEAAQAEGALAQGRAQLAQALSRESAARVELQNQFPGLTLPRQLPTVQPRTMNGSAASWLAAILAHNHELRFARNQTLRMQLLAQRSDQERLPDPTLGFKLANDRGGEERTAGLMLSFALPGSGRQALARASLAEADAAAEQEAAVLRRLQAEGQILTLEVQNLYAAWQQAQAAAERQEQAASMVERAYALGEGSLSETLLARRLAFEARLAAQLARLDILEKQDRLLLDTHQLWPLDVDDADGGMDSHRDAP